MAANTPRWDNPKAFHLQRLEESTLGSAPFEEDPLQLRVAEFLFIRKSSGTIEMDFRRHPLADNHFYFLSPGQYRRLCPAGPIEGYYLAPSSRG